MILGGLCLLQVGLYEMKVMPEKTGGCVVMSDSFSLNVYKDSLKKFLETDSTGSPTFLSLCSLLFKLWCCSRAPPGIRSAAPAFRVWSLMFVGQIRRLPQDGFQFPHRSFM